MDPVATAGVVTAEQLSGLTTIIRSNVEVLLPVGITIMGIMIGIKLIPTIIHKFL